MILERIGKRQHCYLVELKEGDNFDTKKAASERESLHRFMTAIAPHIAFTTTIHFCCFHCLGRAEIVKGFKKKISSNEAMTGPEFCELLHIDYSSVLEKRREHQAENLRFFVEELIQIQAVQSVLNDVPGFGSISWDDNGSGEKPH